MVTPETVELGPLDFLGLSKSIRARKRRIEDGFPADKVSRTQEECGLTKAAPSQNVSSSDNRVNTGFSELSDQMCLTSSLQHWETVKSISA